MSRLSLWVWDTLRFWRKTRLRVKCKMRFTQVWYSIWALLQIREMLLGWPGKIHVTNAFCYICYIHVCMYIHTYLLHTYVCAYIHICHICVTNVFCYVHVCTYMCMCTHAYLLHTCNKCIFLHTKIHVTIK